MSKEAARAAVQPPSVNVKGLKERKILQVELFRRDSQLRNFAQLRERLVAAGQDANAMYRKIEARRDIVAAELKKITPKLVRPANAAALAINPTRSVLSLPIAPPRLNNSGLGSIFGFGYSGSVQMGPAAEGVDTFEGGKYPASGDIYTVALSDAGGITFDGDLSVGPAEIDPNLYDPSLDYFWIHNWSYLIPFPAASILSTFAYSFDVYVQAALNFSGGEGTIYSFISVGETANLQAGEQVVVNTDAGWPLVADMTQSRQYYNGHYGYMYGDSTVQRSFEVGAGQTPGVAVVLGVICAMSMMSEVYLNFPGLGEGYITPGGLSENGLGLVNFHYQPRFIENPFPSIGAIGGSAV
jgi:hypothetical protein